jgi:hypothetical protein
MQIQPLDKHPHEHGGARILQQDVRRFAKDRLQEYHGLMGYEELTVRKIIALGFVQKVKNGVEEE